MTRLASARNTPGRGFLSVFAESDILLNRAKGDTAPSYVNLVIALKFVGDTDSEGETLAQIEGIYQSTGLRRFEFLDAVSLALETGYLSEGVFDISPFNVELRSFENNRQTILKYNPNPKLRETLHLMR